MDSSTDDANAPRTRSPLDVDALLADLTIEEKAALCSGAGFWHTRAIERLGIPSLHVSDGPHGLRIQLDGGDHLGIESSEPATCFPPAVTLGSTWNPDVARAVGEAIGHEARAAGLDVVLGPGVNIKRSPLCGRNFEYFSEDPHVAAQMGAAWVHGVQSTGVGASLKHFAVNNQETDRLRVSAEVDARALREIYLGAFEPIVRDAAPATVMCAYNRINGVYAAENQWLLIDVLRNEWGFEGLVVSDWGAVNDPVASVAGGLDLEMPSSAGTSAAAIVAAIANNELPIADLDRAVRCLLELINRSPSTLSDAAQKRALTEAEVDAHHELARTVAVQGAVLLKNANNLLPIRPKAESRIALIGELARTPRFQGAGSSQVNPTRVDRALDAFQQAVGADITIDFAPGYIVSETTDRGDDLTDEAARVEHLDQAVALGQDADYVVVFAGLPPMWESEGFDRTRLELPADQLALIDALTDIRDDVIVVLSNGGAVVVSSFNEKVGALLECWLGGQASGSAAVELILGVENPSGKLTETIPLRLQDTPSYSHFPGDERVVHYGEGIFVGYRHYDTVDRAVAYPFGFGLSYTTFAYEDFVVDVPASSTLDDLAMNVTVTVTNTGTCAGAEVVQVYVSHQDAPVARPAHELRAFRRVLLAPGESARVSMSITRRALARWSTQGSQWVCDPGEYGIAVGASSRDIRCSEKVHLDGAVVRVPLDDNSTLGEWIDHPAGHDLLVEQMRTSPFGDLSGMLNDKALLQMIGPFPLRRLIVMLGGTFGLDELRELVDQANTSGVANVG